jgi:NADH dehydrogenase FAD-containing subunit
MKRRAFLSNLGATGLGLSLLQKTAASNLAATGATGRVVVVGGGMAGTTAAKYLRFWGGTGMDVTLVEPNATYYSNIFSNKVLTGEKTLSQLGYTYSTLASKYGVKVINSTVTTVDKSAKTVSLANGSTLSYDHLILATGIDFEPLPLTGTDANKAKILHAWKAGQQTTDLYNQIKAMTKADTYILCIPPKPFRCPPGPYERACVIADYLKRVKGGGKVIVLDANSGIQAQPTNFNYAFTVTHKGVITYVPNAIITSINADTMNVTLNTGVSYTGKVINAIPTHKAPQLLFDMGLINSADGKWPVVNELTYTTTTDLNSGIHVIGDSSSTKKQPKAGHIANAEAKVCAEAIIQSLGGGTINSSPITNSSCFTPITSTTASWLSAVYRYDPAQSCMAPMGGAAVESNGANSHNYEDMNKWFNNLMADTFS